MRLGVDFGTTRIVVAAADRGNFPLVTFDAPDGEARDWFPSLIAERGSERAFGWDAWQVQGDPDWTIVRSIKRLLKDAGPKTGVQLGAEQILLGDLIAELLQALQTQLRNHSTLRLRRGEPLEVMIGVPANANSNQRFLTAEAFRAAGFRVLGMLNEPSAAGVEYGHLHRQHAQAGQSVLIYDLGGGTFDASLVKLDTDAHVVTGTAGLPEVGGDDFDEILADLALETADVPRESLSASQWFRLCEECRERKESLHPNTRKVVVDLEHVQAGLGEASISVSAFYERCRPLIEQTQAVVEELMASHADGPIETLYVTGGGSELPAVSRVLRETFGRRVRRSAYMRSATAIGLAIGADDRSVYALRDRFSRNFGVWREADDGRNIVFDLLFPRGLELPAPGVAALRVTRSYHPAHNIGHFRYVECSRIDSAGLPAGDLTMWDEVRFPFDPSLRDQLGLGSVPVQSSGEAGRFRVEEEYTCDAGGMVKVTISNTTTGHASTYALGRWSADAAQAPVAAGAAQRGASRRARNSG